MFKQIVNKYKDIIPYIVFGILTTLVNMVVYWICAHAFRITVVVASIIAWVAAVLFAYVTNRKWVFYSEAFSKREIIKEIVTFFSCRLLTGVVDWVIMYVFAVLIGLDDVIIKAIANVVVIVLNYMASKFLIFSKR